MSLDGALAGSKMSARAGRCGPGSGTEGGKTPARRRAYVAGARSLPMKIAHSALLTASASVRP